MYDLKNKTCIVWDRGSYVSIAERLAREFGRVQYYMPTASAYMTYNTGVVGTGIYGVERIYDFWANLAEADFIYFADCYDGSTAEFIRSFGKPVFSSGYGEQLELDRVGLLKHMEKIGLPTGQYEVLHGLDNLREYLKKNNDKYIKVSYIRGSFETRHHETYDLSRPWLDALEHEMGIVKQDIDFVCADPITPAIELGSDLICLNGIYAKKGIWGIEIKDLAYCCSFGEVAKFPRQILNVNDKLANTLLEFGYRGSLSTEIRVTKDGKGYLGDLTARSPEPPTPILMEMYSNYGEMAYGAALGEIVEPVTKMRYGAEVIITSEWANTEPQAIYFPESIRRFVKIKNHCIKNGTNYYVPCNNVEMSQIGALVFGGNDIGEIILEIKYMAKSIKGYDVKVNVESLDAAVGEIAKLKEFGIKNF